MPPLFSPLFKDISDLRNIVLDQGAKTLVTSQLPGRLPTLVKASVLKLPVANPLRLQQQTILKTIDKSALTAPVSPSQTVTDKILFSDADNPQQQLYLPRYRLATETVTNQQQYRLSLAPDAQGGWRLTAYLQAYAAPEIEQQAHSASLIEHSTDVLLLYQWHQEQGELQFQEVTKVETGRLLKAVLKIDSLEQRDSIYLAITDSSYDAALMVRRKFAVAIPQPPATPSVSPLSAGTATIRGTWTFDFETGREGGSGDVWWQQKTKVIRSLTPKGGTQFAYIGKTKFETISFDRLKALTYNRTPIEGNDDATNRLQQGTVFAVLTRQGNYSKVQVLDYGYNLKIRWETYAGGASRSAERSPTLVLDDVETSVVRGKTFNRYQLSITNWSAFPDELFAPAPDLPPCGLNKNSSRTWVSIHAEDGRKLYGFCALSAPKSLQDIWFAVPAEQTPPKAVYVTLNDRKTKAVYTSNNIKITGDVEPAERFTLVTKQLNDMVDDTFFFPPLLYEYIFRQMDSTVGQSNGLIVRPVEQNGMVSNYYQDSQERHRFYYLPDRFEIGTRLETNAPAMSLRFAAPEGSFDAEQMVAELDYYAAPVVDEDRLSAAVTHLSRYAPDPLPAGADGLEFLPLRVGVLKFHIALPRADGSVGLDWEREARVSLQDGIFDTLRLPLIQFQSIWDAIFSSRREKTLFTGYVEVSLEAVDPPEQIPFAVRFEGDPDELYERILEQTSPTQYIRTIEVRTVDAVFAAPPDRPEAEILAILVDFENSDTVELTAGSLTAQAKVRLPISDFVLRRADEGVYRENEGVYRYRTKAIRKHGASPVSEWAETTMEIVYPDVEV